MRAQAETAAHAHATLTEEQLAELTRGAIRHDRTRAEIGAVFALPLTRLIRVAQTVHARFWPDDEVQLATLLSIKTGGCKEDCGYCPQSAHHQTGIDTHALLPVDAILASARAAKAAGSTRFCMGAAWRSPPTRGTQFDQVLTAVRAVADEGLEVCVTLGMLSGEQAQALKAAGAHTVNHNLDTAPEYYDRVITTRTYQDRLDTLARVREAGLAVCTGGIVGMGETRDDRVGLLHQLASLTPHPESVPINLLVKIDGTPLATADELDLFELVRTIATARILMPKARVRLSAGRTGMSEEAQALCLLAGANSIFAGEKLLVTPNPGETKDRALLARMGLRASEAVSAH
jgi:biotin synthase